MAWWAEGSPKLTPLCRAQPGKPPRTALTFSVCLLLWEQTPNSSQVPWGPAQCGPHLFLYPLPPPVCSPPTLNPVHSIIQPESQHSSQVHHMCPPFEQSVPLARPTPAHPSASTLDVLPSTRASSDPTKSYTGDPTAPGTSLQTALFTLNHYSLFTRLSLP